MSEHTKGPLYHSSTESNPSTAAGIHISNGNCIGTAHTTEDARLWASAPAMYEALRALLYDIDCLPDSIKEFLNTEHVKAGEDALALAEGLQEPRREGK